METSICTIRSRAAKRTENASCNFMKLSSLSDENSTHRDKAQNQTITKYATTAHSDKNIEKPKPQKESEKKRKTQELTSQ